MPAMARNAEVIRHWQMLLHIDAMRAGVSVKDLATRFKTRSASARGCSAGAPTLRFDATAPPAPKGRRLPLRS